MNKMSMNNMSLYEIDEMIEACVDAETGEIIDVEALDALEMARADKIEGVACWAKAQTALAKSIEKEIKAMQERKAAAENRAKRLKQYLYDACGGQRFQSARADVRFQRTAPAVVIDDGTELPDEYMRVKTEVTPNKDALKAALKAGETIPGVRLETHMTTIIK